MNLSSLVARVGSIVARSGAAHCTFLSGIATAKELGMRLRKACSLVFKKPHSELDVPGLVKATLKTPTDTGIAMLVADIFGADRRPALTKLSVPALVLASSASPLLDVQKEMAASIPGSKFLIIDGAGHAVFIDEPEKCHDALQNFLNTLSSK